MTHWTYARLTHTHMRVHTHTVKRMPRQIAMQMGINLTLRASVRQEGQELLLEIIWQVQICVRACMNVCVCVKGGNIIQSLWETKKEKKKHTDLLNSDTNKSYIIFHLSMLFSLEQRMFVLKVRISISSLWSVSSPGSHPLTKTH